MLLKTRIFLGHPVKNLIIRDSGISFRLGGEGAPGPRVRELRLRGVAMKRRFLGPRAVRPPTEPNPASLTQTTRVVGTHQPAQHSYDSLNIWCSQAAL